MTHYDRDTGGQFRPPLFEEPTPTRWERACAHAAKGILAGAGLMGLASVLLLLGDEAIRLWTMGR